MGTKIEYASCKMQKTRNKRNEGNRGVIMLNENVKNTVIIVCIVLHCSHNTLTYFCFMHKK